MTVPQTAVRGNRSLLLGMPGFAALIVVMICLSGLLLAIAFKGPGDRNAIVTSAFIAAVVQIAAFPAVRGLAAKNLIVGWGAGSLVRFLTLFVYAFLAGTVLALPLPAALISLAVFYFLSMVVEPLFLRL